MAYEKQNWKCGDIVSAEKLNHMEDGIAECCSGGDVGYECTSEWVTLTDESVTTVADEDSYEGNLAYSTPIIADTIKVTFDSVEYICNRRSAPNNNCEYGALWDDATESYDFSEFPFKVNSSSRGNLLVTATAGTYSIKMETFESSVETSECFQKAVRSVVSESSVLRLVPDVTTRAEAIEAFNKGAIMYFINTKQIPNRYEFITSFSPDTGSMGSTPATNILSVGFREEDDTFHYTTR